MRPIEIIPPDISRKILAHTVGIKWDKNPSQPFTFKRPEEPLYKSNTAVFSNSPITQSNSFSFAPFSKRPRFELGPLIGNNMFWFTIALMNRPFQKIP